MKTAVFPGSFDPVTKGHIAVLNAVLPLFDKIYVAIGVNADKSGCFPVEKRKLWLQQCLMPNDKVEIIDYQCLTIDLCEQLDAHFIIRGIRNPIDFQYEKDIATANKQLCPGLETIFVATEPELSHVSSSLVRDVFRHHGNVSHFIPEGIRLEEI